MVPRGTKCVTKERDPLMCTYVFYLIKRGLPKVKNATTKLVHVVLDEAEMDIVMVAKDGGLID